MLIKRNTALYDNIEICSIEISTLAIHFNKWKPLFIHVVLDSCEKIIPIQASNTQGQNNCQFWEEKNSLKPSVWNWTCYIKEFLLDKFCRWDNDTGRTQKVHVSCYYVIPKFVIRLLKVTKADFSVLIFYYISSVIKGSNFAVSRIISLEFSLAILYMNLIVNVTLEKGSGLKARRQSSSPNSLWNFTCKMWLWPSGDMNMTVIPTPWHFLAPFSVYLYGFNRVSLYGFNSIFLNLWIFQSVVLLAKLRKWSWEVELTVIFSMGISVVISEFAHWLPIQLLLSHLIPESRKCN